VSDHPAAAVTESGTRIDALRAYRDPLSFS